MTSSSLSDSIGQPLTWVPTAVMKECYNLVATNNTILATLDMSNWTSKAHASVPEGTLFLHTEGWSGLKVVLSLGEQGPPLATFQRTWTWTNGQLIFSDGRVFRWSNVNFWGTQKAWTDPTGNVVYAQFSSDGFSRKLTVKIKEQAAGMPELAFLLVLGLYSIILERRDAAIVVVIVAAASLVIH